MKKEEVLEGLLRGRELRCDRINEPLLPWLLKLVEDGVLKSELVEDNAQYSYVSFRAIRSKQ